MRAMTYRERKAAQKVLDAFQPDMDYGNFVVCDFIEENQAWEALREQVENFVPEQYRSKISWIRKFIDPDRLWDKDLSIGWSYSP